MHTVKKSYRDETGAAITGATGWIEARDSEGNVFDFDNSTWKATVPAEPQGVLSESLLVPGDYEFEFDESTWGTRTVTYLLYIAKDGSAPELKEETRTFINGAVTVPDFTPVAPPGSIYLILNILNQNGTVPSSVPGWAYIREGPALFEYQAEPKQGVWDPVSMTLSWVVPIGCPVIQVVVPLCQELSYWSTVGATENIVLNTATPLRRL